MADRVEHVVAIGASSGGLEALKALVGRLADGVATAYVIAQHLAPDHPSKLVDLLRRCTQLKVVQASNRTPLEPGLIVVVPPSCNAELEHEIVVLSEPERRFGPSPSIDLLFESLAREWSDRGVALVLSGAGSDGACGLRAVGAAGGVTLVQSPESARFPSMPLAAIALGVPDLVADPTTLAARLQDLAHRQPCSPEANGSNAEALLLTSVVAQLQKCTGIDFSLYKQSTLRRQIHRRLSMRAVSDIAEYLSLLVDDPGECQALMLNLLVTVTSFFRNPDSFSALSTYLEPMLARRLPGEQLRVWVPGCATGEEVYSIAMAVSEALGHPHQLARELKIFATDLDDASLRIARRGVYPLVAARAIPEELRQRFTMIKGDDFEISKDLRSCIVFARHNICDDPPFPSMDLVSCRNLLIYFTSALQEQVIDLLGLSLHPGGLLFLGTSESLPSASGFRLLNPTHRIYERTNDDRQRRRLARAIQKKRAPVTERLALDSPGSLGPESGQHQQLIDAYVRAFAKPSLVLDEHHHLLEVIGDVSPYCRIPQGQITVEAGTFLREELQSEARALFLLVRTDRSAVRSCSLHLPTVSAPVWLEAAPLQVGERVMTVLTFHQEPGDQPPPVEGPTMADRDGVFAREIARLERELIASQDTLRRSMLDLEQVNQELEASSEELQASAEELQSSNEELEASNEELQATNDELAALNQQLRIRGDELELLNTDLENIQTSLNQGMVIVDRELRITRFSPLAVRVFGLVASDVGQSLFGIPTTLPIPRLRESLLKVINGQPRLSLEAAADDTAYLVQLMPYRNADGLILGGIITLTDVSELVALRHVAEASLQEFTSLANALDQVVWKRDHTLQRFLYLSPRIENLTGWSVAELCGDAQRFDGAIHPDDWPQVASIRQAGLIGWSVTYRLICKDGSIRSVCEVCTILDEMNQHYAVGTLADVTDQVISASRAKLFECALSAYSQQCLSFVALVDTELQVVAVGESFAAQLASVADDWIGHPLDPLAAQLLPVNGQPVHFADASASLPAIGEPLTALVLQAQQRHRPCTLRCQMIPVGADAPCGVCDLVIHPLAAGEENVGTLLGLTASSCG